MNREWLNELMFKLWWWARVYALYAAILFAILWVIANCSGCASEVGAAFPATRAETKENLSLRLSTMMAEMRKAGCWPTAFSLTYSCPTNYSISISGKYYDALDLNRTNLHNNAKKGN